ncbi:S41 family peptidase [Flavobacterium aquicola]|uniref:C-terminal processing protease CtpA/Prc n=1 Tax=Flavobacterium aquicola TaxID=1682742 RepID=A0A3E0ESD5_9FLAO|nr:S41 family peptidase [Flavobacterium aquicola]REH01143.1 C-terminal processing protease CtpA/Prc [Flavobacterium aquicola]
MKNKIFLLFLFAVQTAFSSNITENQKLATICKVWGFLKYYHPNVADGSNNWDEQLFTILPLVEKAQSQEEFSLVLENWINNLGEVKEIAPITKQKNVEYFDKNFNLSWVTNSKVFSKSLSKKLKFIEKNRYQGKQYYVQYDLDNGNILQFNNEVKYADFKLTDKNLCILTLFRYWNYVEYFFPYKYQMDQKWDITLEKMIPLFTAAKNEDDFYDAMRRLTVKLNDSHVVFYRYSTPGSNKILNYFPAKCKIIDEKIVVTEIRADSLAEAQNIKIGTVITKVNNKTIKEIIAENRGLIPASNVAVYLDRLTESALSGYSDNVQLEFLQNGKYITKTINWYNEHDSHRNEYKKGAKIKKEKFKVLDNNIGYVDMEILQAKNVPDMIETLQSTKAIIFDIRNHPKDTNYAIAEFLNPEPKEFVKFIDPDLSFPGRYIWRNGIETCGRINPNYYKGKVILLVNEKSISHSEYSAMCLKTAPNATIIGSQTAGADGANACFQSNGFQTWFTCYGVFYPDKKETQRIGIVPDIEVKPTIKGIQEGKDEVLDRALQFINKGK